MYGCKKEKSGACAACKDGFLLFNDKSCVYGCKTKRTGYNLLKKYSL